MSANLFPKNFLWGASTAAHQVEGNQHNSWSEWELVNAERLAAEAPKLHGKNPAWPTIKAAAGDPSNYISGAGVEHYTRYEEDFDLLLQLNCNSFRFSIEWSRLEPSEGQWDEAAIRHYRQYIAALKKRGIEPIPTLWHWTMPVWFTQKGGFAKHSNVRYFERFAQKCAEIFGEELHYLITLNEPNVYVSTGYLIGMWPPGRKNPFASWRVYRNLMRAHQRAFAAIKRVRPKLQVGLAMSLAEHKPLRPRHPLDRLTARAACWVWNDWFLDKIRGVQDFVGINYYMTNYYRNVVVHNPKTPLNDMGWYMEPRGILPVLTRTAQRYHKPIIITENGLADAADKHRRWWLAETLAAMEQALQAGVDLRGYLHWSLLDNFEWSSGWWPKFGLIAVDRQHGMRRTIRPSAAWFAEQLKARQAKTVPSHRQRQP